MNIGELALACDVTTDTIRFYEKQKLLDRPQRGANGYRRYADEDIRRVRFIRSAQTLGFSLAEIRDIVPELIGGRLGRAQIEQKLSGKITEIDRHMKKLRALRRELVATFDQLACSYNAPMSVAGVTRTGRGSDARKARVVRRAST